MEQNLLDTVESQIEDTRRGLSNTSSMFALKYKVLSSTIHKFSGNFGGRNESGPNVQMYDPAVMDDTHNLSEQDMDVQYRSIPSEPLITDHTKPDASVFMADQPLNEEDE